MTEAARLDVVVGADIDKALRGFDHVERRMGTFSQTALGMFAGGMLQRGLDAFAGTVTSGFDRAFTAVSDYEQRTMAMENLVAREIKRGSEVTEVIGQRKRGLSKEEQDEYDNLIGKMDEYGYKQQGLMLDVERGRARLAKADNPLDVETANYALQGMERDYNDLQAQISAATDRQAELNGLRDQSIDITQTRQTMQQAEALALAGGRAKELLEWTEQLAVESPFDQKGISTAFQQALNYGFVSDEAKRLTQDIVDFSAATGASTDKIGNVMYAFAQMRNEGRVLGQDLRQLTSAGFDVYGVLDLMGVTMADVSRGTVDSEKFIETAMQMMESDFGGAAARSQETWTGLMNSLGDITDIGLRKFATPIGDAVKPLFVNLVGELNTPEAMAKLEQWGEDIGSSIGGMLSTLEEKYALGRNWLLEVLGLEEPGLDPTEGLMDPNRVKDSLGVGDIFDAIKKYFEEHSSELPGIIEDWLINGISGAAIAVSQWAMGEQAGLGQVGHDVGSGVGYGIKSFFVSTDTSDGIADSVAVALANAAIKVGASATELGAWIGAEFVTGMIEQVTGELPDWATEAYKDFLTISPTMNPMLPWDVIKMVGELYETPTPGERGTGPDVSWMAGNANMGQLMTGQSGIVPMTMLPGAAGGDVNFTYINQGVHQGSAEELRAMLEEAVVNIMRDERATVGGW